MSCLLPDNPTCVFRLNDNGMGPELLRQVFLERGWLEFDEETQLEYDWNLWWRTSRFRTSDYNTVFPWQRLNHYPKSTLITKKDGLARCLRRMQCVHGSSVFNFAPISFNLPNDYTKYVKVYGAFRQKCDGKVMPLWIFKPADLSRGRGIFLFRDLSELVYDCNAVVQHYIQNPLLIGGYKFDLRIYVAVHSFHPLQIYIHEEGIVRFSTAKFDLNSTNNVFAHLTNTSINKYSPGYTEDKETVGAGCKWTLSQLRHYFLKNNVNDRMLWKRIINIVILTLLVQAPQVQKVDNCFELYGFDILIDDTIKPWLLEVNFSPSLSSDCKADVLAKKTMLHDLLDLLQFRHKDAERGGEEFRRYYTQFSTHSAHRKKMPLPQKTPSYRRDRRQSRLARHSAKSTDSCRIDTDGRGLSVMRPLRGSRENSSTEEVREDTENGKDDIGSETDGNSSKQNTEADLTDEVPNVNRNYVEEALDSMMDQALDERDERLGSKPRSPSLPNKTHAKASVSAESHNSGVSGHSKISADSGIGSLSSTSEEVKVYNEGTASSKSLRSSAKSGRRSQFSSLPDFLCRSRLGSGINRHSGASREEDCLHLPSLSHSTSSNHSKRSKQTSLTPRSTSQCAMENYDLQDMGGFHNEGISSQTRKKSSSMKSLLSISNECSSEQRRYHSEDSGYLTHRSLVSMASFKSSDLKGFRHSLRQRKKPWLQETGRAKQSQSRQAKSAQHSSYASLVKRVGSFYLVFPFNEVTYKTSLTNLDAKTVIRETQRMVKESLNSVSHSKPCADLNDFNTGSEELWAPL